MRVAAEASAPGAAREEGVALGRGRQRIHRAGGRGGERARGAGSATEAGETLLRLKISVVSGKVGEQARGERIATADGVRDLDGKAGNRARRPPAARSAPCGPKVIAVSSRPRRSMRASASSTSVVCAIRASSSSLTLRISASSAASSATARIASTLRHSEGRRLTSTDTSVPASPATRTARRCAAAQMGSPRSRLPIWRMRESTIVSAASSSGA